MISHELKCIFIHLPRTGGTSIEYAFIGTDWCYKDVYTKHISSDIAQNLYADYWDRYLKFGIVRNPFDWLVSWQINFDKGRNVYTLDKMVRQAVNSDTLSDFYRWERMYPQFYRNLQGIDYILRFENLQADFDKLCRNLPVSDYQQNKIMYNFRLSLQDKLKKQTFLMKIFRKLNLIVGTFRLENHQKTEFRMEMDYSKYYDESLRLFVTEHWKKDLETFNYQW